MTDQQDARTQNPTEDLDSLLSRNAGEAPEEDTQPGVPVELGAGEVPSKPATTPNAISSALSRLAAQIQEKRESKARKKKRINQLLTEAVALIGFTREQEWEGSDGVWEDNSAEVDSGRFAFTLDVEQTTASAPNQDLDNPVSIFVLKLWFCNSEGNWEPRCSFSVNKQHPDQTIAALTEVLQQMMDSTYWIFTEIVEAFAPTLAAMFNDDLPF